MNEWAASIARRNKWQRPCSNMQGSMACMRLLHDTEFVVPCIQQCSAVVKRYPIIIKLMSPVIWLTADGILLLTPVVQ